MMRMIKISNVWIEKDAIWIETSDGNKACEYFKDYPRLKKASKEELSNFKFDEFGINWPDLDEDLSFEGFFSKAKKEETVLHKIFMEHPELNASAIARRLGIRQSLLASYICGQKSPSDLRMMEIIDCIHQVGKELLDIEIPDKASN